MWFWTIFSLGAPDIFIFIDKYILFCKQLVPVFIPYAQINLLLGEGKTDQKSRTATA